MSSITTTVTSGKVYAVRVKYRSKVGRTCTKSPYYANVEMWKKSIQEYVPEHRAYPLAPLDALTFRSLVTTDVWWYQRFTNIAWSSDSADCERKIIDILPWSPSGIVGSCPAPDPDWQTPLRLAIKDRSLNLAETLYEYRETCDMFAGAARAARRAWDAYRGIRKGKIRFGSRDKFRTTKSTIFTRKVRMDDIAAAELTASFGVNPLLGVLKDSMDRLNGVLLNPPAVHFKKSVHATSEHKYIAPGFVVHDTDIWCRRTRSASFYVWFDPEHPDFIMGNPVELAWELIPFSWLIDGLIDVGSYLASLDALRGVKAVKGTLTERTRYGMRYGSLRYSHQELVQEGRGRRTQYKRDVYNTIPLGHVSWVASSSWRKVMHAVSALVLMRGGRKQSSNRPFTNPPRIRGA